MPRPPADPAAQKSNQASALFGIQKISSTNKQINKPCKTPEILQSQLLDTSEYVGFHFFLTALSGIKKDCETS